jgi:hypothetical protein
MPMLVTHGRTEGIKYYQASFIDRIQDPRSIKKSSIMRVQLPISSRSLGDEVEVVRDDQGHHPGNTKSANLSHQTENTRRSKLTHAAQCARSTC